MTRRSRLFALTATPLVVVAAVLGALAFSQSDGAAAGGHGHPATAGVSAKELKLRNGMRRLWEDHITWTRLAISA